MSAKAITVDELIAEQGLTFPLDPRDSRGHLKTDPAA